MKTKRNLIQIWLLCAAMLQAVTSGAQPVTKVAAGGYHSLFLKSDGSLWAMGDNQFGELGDGTDNNAFRPERIVVSGVTAIAGGTLHSLFLMSDGSLWGMGYNGNGGLGDGTYGNRNQPEQIVPSGVTAIAAGYNDSLFLMSDGSLWAMGYNNDGELGDGTFTYEWYTNQPERIVNNGVTAIAGGVTHSLFLKSDGSLWAMGDNQFGELGDGTYNNAFRPERIVTNGVTAIAAGGGSSLFVKSDGSLWAMGYNAFGQLGDGTYGTAAPYGTNRPEQIVASGVTAIAAGGEFSLFVKSDGSLWAMGYNYYGQLGDGTYNWTNRPEQILAAYNQISIQLLSSGDVLLSFVGIAGANYALDRSFNLAPANWVPLVTNPAGSVGVLVFTNTPNAATNNFWRIRSVP